MPLVPKLKGANDQASPIEPVPEKTAAPQNTVPPEPIPETPVSEVPAQPVPEGPTISEIPVDLKNALSSIDQQLKQLNTTVSQLQAGEKTPPDFSSVLEEIHSVEENLKKLLAPQEKEEESQEDPVLSQIRELVRLAQKNDGQLQQSLRETANFQVQVRQGMQHDLDSLKKQTSGEQYNSLLKEIASLYVDYLPLMEDESIQGNSRRTLACLFEQMEDLLGEYDAEIVRTEIGEVRPARICKVVNKVYTADESKHNTIAAVRKPGVVRDRVVLYNEYVDVYVYDPDNVPEEIPAPVPQSEESDVPAPEAATPAE